MAIARPNAAKAAAETAAPATKPAATKPAAPKPAATKPAPPPVEDVEVADPELALQDHSMDVPDEDAPPVSPIATTPPRAATAVATREPREDDEYDDLESEVGFGSYEIMKLDKHEYICGEHTFDGRTGVQVIIHGSKRKFLHKPRKGTGDDDDMPLAYSYDNERATDGRPLEEHYKEWQEAGHMEPGAKAFVSRYRECGAQIVMPGHPLDGDMVLLNVAPASVTRLAGYSQKIKLKTHPKTGKPLALRDVVTLLTLGKKVQPKGTSKTFFPWEFKLVGLTGE